MGPYELTERLGAGGMGVVFRARHRELGTDCALKVLPPGASVDLQQRFQREGEALARVDDHPNVIRVHAAGVEGGRHYLVMELIEGEDLEAMAREPLPPREASRIVRDLARGVAHVHRGGVLHRDIKPENVLVSHEGIPKLVDFGLADMQEAASLTASGQMLGTPAYMSPEQANGERAKIGPAADVYGLGGVLFRLLAGRPPFEGHSVLNILSRVVQKAPPRPSSLQPGVPHSLDALCLRALAKEPEDRPSASELADALEAFLAGESDARDRVRKILIGLGALIVVLAGAVGAVALLRQPSEAPERPAQPLASKPPPTPPKQLDPKVLLTELQRLRNDPLEQVRAADRWLAAFGGRPEVEAVRKLRSKAREVIPAVAKAKLVGAEMCLLLPGRRVLARQQTRAKVFVAVWELGDALVAQGEWSTKGLEAIAKTRDGSLFAYGDDGAVKVRSSATLELLSEVLVPEYVEVLAFAPDGETLAVGYRRLDADLTALSVDLFTIVDDGKPLAQARKRGTLRDLAPEGHVNALVFSRDGALIAAANQHKTSDKDGNRFLAVWRVSGEQIAKWPIRNPSTLAFTADPTLILGDQNGLIWSYELAPTAKPEGVERPDPFPMGGVHASRVSAMRISLDGRFMITAGGGHSKGGKDRFNDIVVWSRDGPGAPWQFVRAHSLQVARYTSLDLSADGSQLLIADSERVELWPVEAFRP